MSGIMNTTNRWIQSFYVQYSDNSKGFKILSGNFLRFYVFRASVTLKALINI